MLRTTNFSKAVLNATSGCKIVAQIFCGLLLAFVLVKQPDTAQPGTISNTLQAQQKNTTVHLCAKTYGSTHSSSGTPYKIPYSPQDQELFDEDGLEDKDDDNSVAVELTIKDYTNSNCFTQTAIAGVSRLMHTLSRVSLFILYHSWKSFIF